MRPGAASPIAWYNQPAVAVLREAAEDDDPLVREHAACALGRADAVRPS